MKKKIAKIQPENPEEARETEEERQKALLMDEAAAYEQLILTAGWQQLEKSINDKISQACTKILQANTTQEEAEQTRHFARGLTNVIDLVNTTIEAARQIRKDETEDKPDEGEGG
jgi:hypothetical protein